MEYTDCRYWLDIIMHSFRLNKHIAAVCKEVVAGLSCSHANGIVHHDIKGDNILLSMNGNVKISKYLV